MTKGFRIETIESPEFIQMLNSRLQSDDSPLIRQYSAYCLIREDMRTALELNKIIDDLLKQKYLFLKQHIPPKPPPKKLNKQQTEDFAYNVNVYNTLLIQSLFTTIIITYAKWFSSSKNKPKLEPTDIFKNAKKLTRVHQQVMDYRNSYFAHSGDNHHENTIAIYFPAQNGVNDFLLGWPFKKRMPSLQETKDFNVLFLKVFDHICAKIGKMESKTKMVFTENK